MYSPIRTESIILPLYGNIQVKENPYGGIFYAIKIDNVGQFMSNAKKKMQQNFRTDFARWIKRWKMSLFKKFSRSVFLNPYQTNVVLM